MNFEIFKPSMMSTQLFSELCQITWGVLCFQMFLDAFCVLRMISIGSMVLDNPKVDYDTFILVGLVYVGRLGSASLKVVQQKRRGTRKILKSLYYTTFMHCATIYFRWCKVLEWKYWHFYFFHHFQLIQLKQNISYWIFWFSFFQIFLFFLWALEFSILGFRILNPWIEDGKS